MSNRPDEEKNPNGISTDLCWFCNKIVDKDDPTIWQMIRAWVHGKKKDGATLREYIPYYAHDHCVKKAKDGQSPDQEAIFDV